MKTHSSLILFFNIALTSIPDIIDNEEGMKSFKYLQYVGDNPGLYGRSLMRNLVF